MAKIAEWVSHDIFEGVGRLCAYYSYLEAAVAQAIWSELQLVYDEGHPVTDDLLLGDSLRLLLSIHEKNRNEEVVAHLKSLRKRTADLIKDRNLVVHGTIIFDARHGEQEPGIRWLVRRGGYNRKPQPVTMAMVDVLIEECKALAQDISTMGRSASPQTSPRTSSS